MVRGQPYFARKRISDRGVEAHCPTDVRIDGVVEFEVLGQNVNDLYKIRPGKV